MDLPTTISLFTTEGHLVGSHFLAILNDVAKEICVQVCVHICFIFSSVDI